MPTVVSVSPKILGGAPVFISTRVPIESLFDYLKRGRTIDYFLEQFPTVKRQQVEQLVDEAKMRGVSENASEAAAKPGLDEVLAPLRKQFGVTSVGEAELINDITVAQDEYRSEKSKRPRSDGEPPPWPSP